MGRIVFHIGTHKTGTTSFQKSLQKNRKILLSRGVRPILAQKFRNGQRIPGRKAQHNQFVNMLLRPEIKSGARVNGSVPNLSPRERLRRLDRLSERLSAFGEDTLIISAEGLCFLRTSDERNLLLKFLNRINREVQTLVVFRDTKTWEESWRNQLMKNHGTVFDVASAEHEEVSILGKWYFDKEKIREFWSPFNLTEIEFDKSSNIVDSIYKELNLSVKDFETNIILNKRK